MWSAKKILLIYAALIGSVSLFELINDFYQQPFRDLLFVITMFSVVVGILLKNRTYFYPLFSYFVIELLLVAFRADNMASGIVSLVAISLPLVLTIVVAIQISSDESKSLSGTKSEAPPEAEKRS